MRLTSIVWGREGIFHITNPSSSPLGSHEYAQKLIRAFSNSISSDLIKKILPLPVNFVSLTSLAHQHHNSSTASNLYTTQPGKFNCCYCPLPDMWENPVLTWGFTTELGMPSVPAGCQICPAQDSRHPTEPLSYCT